MRTTAESTFGADEDAGGHVELQLHRGEGLEQHREDAVVAPARGRGDPLGDLLLQQEHRPLDRRPLLEQLEQDGAGEVKGRLPTTIGFVPGAASAKRMSAAVRSQHPDVGSFSSCSEDGDSSRSRSTATTVRPGRGKQPGQCPAQPQAR